MCGGFISQSQSDAGNTDLRECRENAGGKVQGRSVFGDCTVIVAGFENISLFAVLC